MFVPAFLYKFSVNALMWVSVCIFEHLSTSAFVNSCVLCAVFYWLELPCRSIEDHWKCQRRWCTAVGWFVCCCWDLSQRWEKYIAIAKAVITFFRWKEEMTFWTRLLYVAFCQSWGKRKSATSSSECVSWHYHYQKQDCDCPVRMLSEDDEGQPPRQKK